MGNNGNPAQRLFDIAKDGNKYTEDRSFNVWAEVFNIPESGNKGFTRDEELVVFSRINQCRKLVDEVESLLLLNTSLPEETKKVYLRPFPKLRTLFCKPSQLYRSHKQNFTLDQTDFTLLELIIHAVEGVYKEKVADENELKDLVDEIQNLYEQVIDLEIDKNLKRILLDLLKIMENAIHEYRIRGVERLHEAVEQLVGIYIVNEKVINNSKIEEVGK
ncbi:MAG: hypothetical protein AAB336_00195, partial [Acidobacteriota bacterium]